MDAYANPIFGYSGIVHLTSSESGTTLSANATLTNGIGMFSATFPSAGAATITATDTVSSAITGSAVVAVTDYFTVSTSSANQTAGSSFNVTVTAVNAAGQKDTSYSGTVVFTSSDMAATLPVNITLTNGLGTFSVTPATTGSQTISAVDSVSSTIAGSVTLSVVPATASYFLVTARPIASRASLFH